MGRKRKQTPAEKRAEDAWLAGHMRAAAIAMDELAYHWEKALGPRHHLVVGFRELAADARWAARNPSQDAVIALGERTEALERELKKFRAQMPAPGRRSRVAATAKMPKGKRPRRSRLRLLRG